MKPIKVQLVGNAAEEFERMNKVVGEEQAKGIKNSEHQQLLRSIKQKIELIKANPLRGNQIEILCFILEIIDHKHYDKIFGYRKR